MRLEINCLYPDYDRLPLSPERVIARHPLVSQRKTNTMTTATLNKPSTVKVNQTLTYTNGKFTVDVVEAVRSTGRAGIDYVVTSPLGEKIVINTNELVLLQQIFGEIIPNIATDREKVLA